jgi:predicted lactoylglutathione lyase
LWSCPSDVDRTKRFYESLGWRMDIDYVASEDFASFASFSDPDGNGWVLQEVRTRAPGR